MKQTWHNLTKHLHHCAPKLQQKIRQSTLIQWTHTSESTHSALVHKPSTRVTVRRDLSSVRYGDVHRDCQSRFRIDTQEQCQRHLPATTEAIWSWSFIAKDEIKDKLAGWLYLSVSLPLSVSHTKMQEHHPKSIKKKGEQDDMSERHINRGGERGKLKPLVILLTVFLHLLDCLHIYLVWVEKYLLYPSTIKEWKQLMWSLVVPPSTLFSSLFLRSLVFNTSYRRTHSSTQCSFSLLHTPSFLLRGDAMEVAVNW